MLRLLFLLALFALATYLLVRLLQERGLVPDRQTERRPSRPRRPQARPQPRIIAPDDDEDFLRDLDRKRLNPDDNE